MASTITKQEKRRQLGELLQQKQEPFVLDLYLLERGYLRKSLSSKLESTGFGCCSNGNFHKLSPKYIPSCSRILKAILSKFTCSSSDRQREAKFSAERERFSSASSTAVFNESYEDELSPSSADKHRGSVMADTLEGLRLSNMTEEEACAGLEFSCRFMANSKQLSPVSVLEQIPQYQESQTTCTVRLPSKLVEEDSTTLSASLCQLNFQSISDKSFRKRIVNDDPTNIVGSNNGPSPQFVISKRMSQQTRQLLLDCVKEIIVESHAMNGHGKVKQRHRGPFGPEKLGNILPERMESYTRTSVLGLGIFNNSAQDWKNGVDSEETEICSEIGDSIAEEIINEVVFETLIPEKIRQSGW